MDNKNEYYEDDDFWYNKTKDEEIETIKDEQEEIKEEIQNVVDIPLEKDFSITDVVPDIFIKDNIDTLETPKEEPLEQPIIEKEIEPVPVSNDELNTRPAFLDERDEEEKKIENNVSKDFKIGILLVVILVIFIIILPIVYNLFN